MPISTKDRFRRFYENWKQESTYSPVLKDKVAITRKGWEHISGSFGGKKRSHSDIHRRLNLLPYAKTLIKSRGTKLTIEERKGEKYFVLTGKVKPNKVSIERHITVVLVEDRQGKKIFYSVMDK